MQFGISEKFQRNEQGALFDDSSQVPRLIQMKLKSLFHNPLTFVILVWTMMFFFAGLYFVYAQDTTKPASGNHRISSKAHSIRSKAAAKKRAAAAQKTEAVEIFSVGFETVSANSSREADVVEPPGPVTFKQEGNVALNRR